MKFKKNDCKQVLFLLFFLLLTPALSFAQLNVEGNYPEVLNISITKASPLGEVVKYIIGWTLIAAGVVVLLSLIGAGVLYLTSAGDTGRMGMARERITKSALGLVILFSSYVVFRIVDPKINIVAIETKPVASGIFLFRDDGDQSFQKFLDWTISISAMVKLGKAYYITNDIPDMNKEFGDFLVVEGETKTDPSDSAKVTITDPTKARLNFKDFSIVGIGFWGDYGQRMKVVTYDWSDFNYSNNNRKEYTYSSARKNVGDIKIVDLRENDFKDNFFNTEVSPNREVKCYNSDEKRVSNCSGIGRVVLHPPLSLSLNGNGPGVYLYSARKEGDSNLPDREKYFFSSAEDFTASNIDFDDKAQFIAIKNKKDTDATDTNDYLAILHEDKNYTGQLKIFFDGRKSRARLACNKECQESLNKIDSKNTKEIDQKPVSVTGMTFPFEFKQPQLFNLWSTMAARNVGTVQDRYKVSSLTSHPLYNILGKVEQPSSLQVFELSSEEGVCKKVRLCTEKNFLGGCVEYTYDNQHTVGVAENVQEKWLPIYKPENLIEKIPVEISQGNDKSTKELKIDNNIRSIQIDGDCAVVLFENPIVDDKGKRQVVSLGSIAAASAAGVLIGGAAGALFTFDALLVSMAVDEWKLALGKGDPEDQAEYDQNLGNVKLANNWDFQGKSPGSHSEVFTVSDSDLTDNEIGKCGVLERIGFKTAVSCASAIAIYPVKALR
jgi:hypothetical protein